MKADREVVKALIELAPNIDEEDKVINENYGFNSIGEKLAFLRGMFDVELFHKHDADETSKEELDEITYFAMLDAIINN